MPGPSMEPQSDLPSSEICQTLTEKSPWARAIKSRLCVNNFPHHYVTEAGCRDFNGVTLRSGDEIRKLNDSVLYQLERKQVLELFDSLEPEDKFNMVVKRMQPMMGITSEEIAVYFHIKARLISKHDTLTASATEDDSVDHCHGRCLSVVLNVHETLCIENIDWSSHDSFETSIGVPGNKGCMWHARSHGDIGVSTSCRGGKENTFDYLIYDAAFPDADIKPAMMLRYKVDNGDCYYLTVEGNELKALQADYESSIPMNPHEKHVFINHKKGMPQHVYAFESLAKPEHFLAHLRDDDGYKLSLIREKNYAANNETHFKIDNN